MLKRLMAAFLVIVFIFTLCSPQTSMAAPTEKEIIQQLRASFKTTIEKEVTAKKTSVILTSSLPLEKVKKDLSEVVMECNAIIIPKLSTAASVVNSSQTYNSKTKNYTIKVYISYTAVKPIPKGVSFVWLNDTKASIDKLISLIDSGVTKVALFTSIDCVSGYDRYMALATNVNMELLKRGKGELVSLDYENLEFCGYAVWPAQKDTADRAYYYGIANICKLELDDKVTLLKSKDEVKAKLIEGFKNRETSINLAIAGDVAYTFSDVLEVYQWAKKEYFDKAGIACEFTRLVPVYSVNIKQVVVNGGYWLNTMGLKGFSLNLGYYPINKTYTFSPSNVNEYRNLLRYALVDVDAGKYDLTLSKNITFNDIAWILYDIYKQTSDEINSWMGYESARHDCYTVPNESMSKTLIKARSVIRSIITPDMTVEERLAAIHDYLVKNVVYDADAYADYQANSQKSDIGIIPEYTPQNYEPFTAYGALINGKAVCDGYSKAFWILSMLAGVQTDYVHGTYNGEGHSWNLVNIGNKDYHIDVTADAGNSTEVSRDYFMVDGASIMADGKRFICGEIKDIVKYLPDLGAAPDTFEKACRLKLLGISQNISNPYDVSRTPTRLEGALTLVRLMGKMKEAASSNYTHPFTDVPKWADKYVAYLYQKGYMKGTAAKSFGTNQPLTEKEWDTAILSALGYTTDKDFKAVSPQDKLYDLKLIKNKAQLKQKITYGDMAALTYDALSAMYKDKNITLLQKLYAEDKVINIDNLLASGIILPKVSQ